MAPDGDPLASPPPGHVPSELTLGEVAHALGAPLCALEVVLAARDHLPLPQAELLEAAVIRLREVLKQAAEAGQNR